MKDELKAAYDAARVDPEALRILSVALSREDGCLTVEVERNARLAADDRLAAWEREIRALIPAYTVSFVYREAAVVPVAPKPSKKKNEVEVPIPENGAIFARRQRQMCIRDSPRTARSSGVRSRKARRTSRSSSLTAKAATRSCSSGGSFPASCATTGRSASSARTAARCSM